MKVKSIFLCATLFLVACSETHKLDFIIEQDGVAESVSVDEFERRAPSFNGEISVEGLKKPTEYFHISDEDPGEELTADFKAHLQIAKDNNYIVNNQIYNFFVAIPIKSNVDFFKFPGFPENSSHLFNTTRCKPLYFYGQGGGAYFFSEIEKVKKENGFFHYTLYTLANSLAGEFMLNNVGDLCLQYKVNGGRYFSGESYSINSNEIIIKAEEIETILNKLGIAH